MNNDKLQEALMPLTQMVNVIEAQYPVRQLRPMILDKAVQDAKKVLGRSLDDLATQAEPHSISMPEGLHPATADLVLRFAQALAEKLHKAEQKYGYSDGWLNNDWMDECRAKLIEHVGKGDPRDVAAYCAFLWHHGERTELAQSQPDPEAIDSREVSHVQV